MKMHLQYFGGRGGSSKMSTGGGSVSTSEVLGLPQGSKISVQDFSSITGKPNGNYVEYTLHNGRWSSINQGSFDNDATGIKSINSKNGVVPKIKRVK